MPTPQLHDYQKLAQKWMIDHPFCGLFMAVGTGKTLTVLDSLFKLNPKGHVLVIAPKAIARSTWIDEIRKWEFPLRYKSLIVNEKGRDIPPKQRYEMYEETLSEPPTVYFINRDKVSDLVKHLPCQKGRRVWPFGIVIIDESQSFKSYSSERFKSMKLVRPACERLVELTGSPMPKDLMDLWSQVYLLDEGERLGKTITAYRERWFTPGLIVNNHPVAWMPREGAKEEIFDAIKDIVVSMDNENLNLPPLTINDIYYHMLKPEHDKYKKLMKEYILDLGNGVVIEAANGGVLYNKLSQIAAGAIYKPIVPGQKKREYEIIHTGKLEITEYLVNNANDNVIIAYHYESDKEMIISHFEKLGMPVSVLDGSPEMIRDWNEGRIPIMLMQPASCGRGLNLQQGGHTLVWYTLPSNLEEYEQTIGRLQRQGQRHPVTVWRILTKGTVDIRATALLAIKDMNQSDLLEAVKAAIDDADSYEY